MTIEVMILQYIVLFRGSRCRLDGFGAMTLRLFLEHSDAGKELEVAIDSSSLVISCNDCLEDYYKGEEGSG